MTVRWKGEELLSKLRRAQISAVNTTMQACVIHAKQNHPWHNRTGSLEGSIQVHEYARQVSGGVGGTWGSEDIAYALRMELGFQGRDARGAIIDQEPRPYLRPAAEVQYPLLARRIKDAM